MTAHLAKLRTTIAVFGIALLLMLWPSNACGGPISFLDFNNPTVLDFTPASGFQELQDYLAADGVTSNANVIAEAINGAGGDLFDAGPPDPINYGRAIGTLFSGPEGATNSTAQIVFAFQQPETEAGATVFYGPGFPLDYPPFSITLTAFSQTGNVLGSVTSGPLRKFNVDVQPDRQFLGFESTTPISYITFSATLPAENPSEGGSALLVDYLTFSAVPEPASLTLFAIGTVAMLGCAWRKRAGRGNRP